MLDPHRGRKGTAFLTTGVTTAYPDLTHFDVALSGGTPGTFAVRAPTAIPHLTQP